ncbi:Basic leucine zipper 23 [Sesamum angolense]|uniref:Basic leucine zipper 23 n=1 Tax=Sesamum angolense TaxID=2727404 RepID=A0AAE1T7J2_9LAMI|nr:Basic leucine zipper 23 [Sesamum angolense]
MDDGEVELSDCLFLPNSDSSSNIQASLSADSFLDDLLRNAQTCTHTHTCNPPGPDTAHTHTCYHTHTHVIPSEEDDDPCDEKSPVSKRQRPLGNREAVRKYREKKKAHAAYLEEEVKKLRLLNQQLMKKLQRQAILEAEIVRLRALLLDLRGKINNELGDFPFQKRSSTITTFTEGECGIQPTDVNGLACGLAGSSVPSNGIDECGKTMAAWETDCQPAIVDCQASRNYIQSAEKRLQDSLETLISSAPQEE